MKNVVFFIHQYLKQMKKKWWKLLLLFVFPVVIISLSILAMTPIFLQEGQQKMSIAIVNEDTSSESELLTQLIVAMLKENTSIQATPLSMEDVKVKMDQNELTAAIVFPQNFAAHLYEGTSVKLQVLGNPQEKTQSMVVYELVETMGRYIASAQANILTVYHYAQKTSISAEELENLKVELLMDFTFYTMGKRKILREHAIMMQAFENPVHYFSFAILFCLTIMWAMSLFVFLGKQTSKSLHARLTLAGVSFWQEHVARIIISFVLVFILVSSIFVIGLSQVDETYFIIDYARILLFVGIILLVTIILCAMVDLVWYSEKGKLLVWLFLCAILLASSGTIFPTIYFPFTMQQLFPYFYTYDSWQWLMDLIFEGRNYASYTKSVLMLCIVLTVYSVLIFVKGRLVK